MVFHMAMDCPSFTDDFATQSSVYSGLFSGLSVGVLKNHRRVTLTKVRRSFMAATTLRQITCFMLVSIDCQQHLWQTMEWPMLEKKMLVFELDRMHI